MHILFVFRVDPIHPNFNVKNAFMLITSKLIIKAWREGGRDGGIEGWRYGGKEGGRDGRREGGRMGGRQGRREAVSVAGKLGVSHYNLSLVQHYQTRRAPSGL